MKANTTLGPTDEQFRAVLAETARLLDFDRQKKRNAGIRACATTPQPKAADAKGVWLAMVAERVDVLGLSPHEAGLLVAQEHGEVYKAYRDSFRMKPSKPRAKRCRILKRGK
jgi:hypothetical protein